MSQAPFWRRAFGGRGRQAMNQRSGYRLRLLGLSVGAAAFLAFTAAEASPVGARSAADLNSGTYQVVVVTAGGKSYRSLWHLHVVANHITGTSEWDCCPGHRVDKLSGQIGLKETDEETLTSVDITRFCVGQGQPAPCKQEYSSTNIGDTRVQGTWSGTGGSGRWTLYLDRVDVRF